MSTARLVMRIHDTPGGREHVDWYASPAGETDRFPIMCASAAGVSYSPAVDPDQLPAADREMAESVARDLATNRRRPAVLGTRLPPAGVRL